ncbi:MAG: DUF421 domain-containing protein [Chitinophagaceae bacterium]|nr:DUF421 domain-containing protein [Chitinophagaceae bacterium]
MRKVIDDLFGTGKELEWQQMCLRAVAIFVIALVLMRISGRRSFGMRTPIDNIIAVLIGALLSRPIVGASPFIPVVAAGTILVLLHRVLAWIAVHSPAASVALKGDKICLYREGAFLKDNMARALVCEEDIRQGVRSATHSEELDAVSVVYMERNGEISVISKHQQNDTGIWQEMKR